jgi:hypothetical protein
MAEAAGPPSALRPKTDSFRVMEALAHDGQATTALETGTYFSKSALHSRQRYS